MTLSDEQYARVKKILPDKAVSDAKLKPQTSSSLFGASSGVGPSSGGIAETKARSDAAVAAALKNASPQEILQAWTAAQTNDGGDPNAEFLEAFRAGRK